jgi:hypothetical protein
MCDLWNRDAFVRIRSGLHVVWQDCGDVEYDFADSFLGHDGNARPESARSCTLDVATTDRWDLAWPDVVWPAVEFSRPAPEWGWPLRHAISRARFVAGAIVGSF